MKTFFKLIFSCLLIIFLSYAQENSLGEAMRQNSIKIQDLVDDPRATVHLILGNQSGDMDSIVSAIALAQSKENAVPLVNIAAADLVLRKDVLFVLEKFGIEPNSLVYKEAIPLLIQQADLGKVRVILVDHNELAEQQKKLAPYVEEIIDHHLDANVDYPQLRSKNIQITGSNSTLIAEEILEKQPDKMTPELAGFLLGPILLDTGNLQDPLKTTHKDIAIVERLRKIAHEKISDTYFEDLIKRKNEVNLARPDLILKKDFKGYREGNLSYGISSLPSSVEWKIENEAQWSHAVQIFLKEEGLDLWIGLMQYENHSELIFYTPLDSLREALITHFEINDALNKVFIYQGYQQGDELLFYRTTSRLPRKVLQPLFNFSKSPLIQSAIP